MALGIIIGLVVSALIALAVTGRLWLPQLLQYAIANPDTIQLLTNIAQPILALAGVVVGIVGIVFSRKGSKKTQETKDSGVSIGEDARDSNVTNVHGNVSGDGGIGMACMQQFDARIEFGHHCLGRRFEPGRRRQYQ